MLGTDADLSQRLREWTLGAGFDLVGIAPVTPGLGQAWLDAFLERGYHGEMTYMERNRAARLDPTLLLPGARSIVVAALTYHTKPSPPSTDPAAARISCYAQGRDYHTVLKDRFRIVQTQLRQLDPTIRSRAVVDSAPLMERDYAQLAGLGWIGKNTLLLNRRLGSFFFLGGLLVDRDLQCDPPQRTDHCGSCIRCLEACPTQAFVAPYQLDARRCISYLTIEHRSDLPIDLRDQLGDWVFGCDICQEVCPWNREPPIAPHPEAAPRASSNPIDIIADLQLTEADFAARFADTPIVRLGWARWIRNLLCLVGARQLQAAGPIVEHWRQHPNPLVQHAAQWASDRLQGTERGPATSDAGRN